MGLEDITKEQKQLVEKWNRVNKARREEYESAYSKLEKIIEETKIEYDHILSELADLDYNFRVDTLPLTEDSEKPYYKLPEYFDWGSELDYPGEWMASTDMC